MNSKILSVVLLFCGTILFAQNTEKRTVTGNISDASGLPVIGATIKVKDANYGTVADVNGNFSLSIAIKETTIVISCIGYKPKEYLIKERLNSFSLKLDEDNKVLDELVVVGYGTQKKSSLTSSIESIKGEDLLRMPVTNLDQALVGQVAGLQVKSSSGDPSAGRESEIHIRGILGSPLLVIDGIPRSGQNTTGGEARLSDLNPDDIESISILKDGAACAVYGARAANGVILVTTKRSKGDKTTRVNYRGQFNVQKATELPKFLNSYDFAKMFNQAVENTGKDTYKPFTVEQLEEIRTHSNPNRYADENLLNYLNNYGFSTIHSLSISGGGEDVKYYTSLGYTNTQGLYSGVGKDRYNYSVKLDANLSKRLKLSVDITGSRSANKNTSYTTIDAAYSFSPLQTLRYTDGSLASISGNNPLISVQGLGGYILNKTSFNTIISNLNYDFEKVKGLSLYLKGTFENNSSLNKTFDKPTELFLCDPQTQEITSDPTTIFPKAKISLREYNSNFDNKLLEAGLNYSRTFAAKHTTSGLLVMNYQNYQSKYLDGTNNNMPGIYPEIIGTSSDSKLSGSEFFSERASMIGRVNYGFDNRYFIESSFRMDGSTKFVKKNRWEIFPTVSASWVVSNEPFFKQINQHYISTLKFRGSTGKLGSDGDIPDFSYLRNYIYKVGDGYNIGGGLKPAVIFDPRSYPNPDLKMEYSKDINFGADLGFWGNRINISFETYSRYRVNMIYPAPNYLFPPSSGTEGNVPNINFGKVKATGWDMTVTHKNTIEKFKYDMSFTLSKAKDVILDYGDESTILESQRRVGQSMRATLLYEADGLFKSVEEIANYIVDQDGNQNSSLAPGDIKYKDQNDDNVITSADKIYVKNSSYPDFSYSFSLGARYNGFFANAMFQGVSGSNQRINELFSLQSSTLPRFQEYHQQESWSPENPEGTYPRVKFASSNDNNRRESTFWIKECNYLRLKSLSFGYAFPASILEKLKLSSLSVSIQGSNLITWSSLKGMDPESLRGYPIQRTGGLTLNLGF